MDNSNELATDKKPSANLILKNFFLSRQFLLIVVIVIIISITVSQSKSWMSLLQRSG